MEGIDLNVPTYDEDEQIDLLCKKLKDLNSETKELQRDSLSLYDVRTLSDAVIVKYPSTNNRLKPDAYIVHCP